MMVSFSITNILCLAGLLAAPVSAIIDGTLAEATTAPFTVAILKTGRLGEGYKCSGALIGPHTVVTTAKCIYDVSRSDIQVRVGSLQRSTGGQLHSVAEVRRYAQYSRQTLANDYGVIILQDAVTDITPAVIADTYPGAGESAVVLGWGVVKPLQSPAENLHQLQAKTIDLATCAARWAGDVLIRGQLCDQPTVARGTVCHGDEGGPVVLESNGHLVGVTSFYDRGCVPGKGANVNSVLHKDAGVDQGSHWVIAQIQ